MLQGDSARRRARSLVDLASVTLVVVLGMVPAYAQAQSLFVTSVQPASDSHVLTIQGGGFSAGLRVFLAPEFCGTRG